MVKKDKAVAAKIIRAANNLAHGARFGKRPFLKTRAKYHSPQVKNNGTKKQITNLNIPPSAAL